MRVHTADKNKAQIHTTPVDQFSKILFEVKSCVFKLLQVNPNHWWTTNMYPQSMHVTRTKRAVQVLPSVEAIYSTTANHLSRGVPISAGCCLFSYRRRIWRSQQCFSPLSKAMGTAAGHPSDLPCCWAYYAAISSCGLLRPGGQLLHPHGSNSIRAPRRARGNMSAPLSHTPSRGRYTHWVGSFNEKHWPCAMKISEMCGGSRKYCWALPYGWLDLVLGELD